MYFRLSKRLSSRVNTKCVRGLNNALPKADWFALTEDRPRTVINEVRAIVSQWREHFADDGVKEADIEPRFRS